MFRLMHSWRLVCRALLISLLTISPIYAAIANAAPHLVIGEVAWSGSSAGTSDEWLELWNLDDADLSISGFALIGASGQPLVFPADTTVPSRGSFLISNYSDTDPKSALNAAPQMVTTAVSLSNSSLSIVLKDATGNELDRVGDAKLPPAGTSGEIKATMIRNGDLWETASSSEGFDAGRTDLGTPGVCDGCKTLSPKIPPCAVVAPTPAPLIIPTTTTITVQSPIAPPSVTTTPMATTTAATTLATSTAATTTEVTASINQPTTSSTTTTASTTSTNATTQTTTVNASAAINPQTTPPRYELLRLNEVLPQPETGNEWVEVTLLERGASVPLSGSVIRDRSSIIYTFATGTLDAEHPFVRVNLSSSRLNNDGDDVTLVDPNGNTRDALTYLNSTKGKSWSRYPDATGVWVMTDPTPENQNAAPQTAASENAVETPPAPEPAPAETAQTISTPTETVTAKMTTDAVPINESSFVSIVVGTKKSASTKIASTTKTKPKPKTTTKLTYAPATASLITFDMTHNDEYHGVRVELTGTVGSPSGLISGHGFILNSPDGRGLLVRIPTAKKLPAQGTSLNLTGTLLFQDSGDVYLKMAAKDSWVTEPEQTNVNPRVVDLFAPKSEDAWSVVSITGVARTVRGKIITINSDGIDIEIGIKPVVNYRASRILAGDTIKVTGLLEPGHDVQRILLRNAEDINIVAHVQPKTASNAQSAVPKWAPIGAAGLAIAGTESVKHLRKRKKIRALEKIVQTDLNTTI
ncbi:MAG: lamin tail domain-containing protein [Patescibacteria group bacterium]